MIEKLSYLSKKDLIQLELEEPELKEYLKLINEIKEETEHYKKRLELLKRKKKINFIEQDIYVISKIEEIHTNKDSYELECENVIKRIDDQLEYFLSILKKEEKNTVLIKRETCELCGKQKNNLFVTNDKKVCLECIEKYN